MLSRKMMAVGAILVLGLSGLAWHQLSVKSESVTPPPAAAAMPDPSPTTEQAPQKELEPCAVEFDGDLILFGNAGVAVLDAKGILKPLLQKGFTIYDVCPENSVKDPGVDVLLQPVDVLSFSRNGELKKVRYEHANQFCGEALAFDNSTETPAADPSENEKKLYRKASLEDASNEEVSPEIWKAFKEDISKEIETGYSCGFDLHKMKAEGLNPSLSARRFHWPGSEPLRVLQLRVENSDAPEDEMRSEVYGLRLESQNRILPIQFPVECVHEQQLEKGELVNFYQYRDFNVVLYAGYEDYYLWSLDKDLNVLSKLRVSNGMSECD